jgi:alanine-glyoxylate transaminase / serine-glyoxylate transaminase / serine-pyruvate transaminase
MGLGRLAGRVFRIGHLGFFNDLTLCGTLCGVEMGLNLVVAPHRAGGAQAALEFLSHDAKTVAIENPTGAEAHTREMVRHV